MRLSFLALVGALGTCFSAPVNKFFTPYSVKAHVVNLMNTSVVEGVAECLEFQKRPVPESHIFVSRPLHPKEEIEETPTQPAWLASHSRDPTGAPGEAQHQGTHLWKL